MNRITTNLGHSPKQPFFSFGAAYNANSYFGHPIAAKLVASALARSHGHTVPDLADPAFPAWLRNSPSATEFDALRIQAVRS